MPFSFLNQSQTTLQVSKHLIPMTIVAGLSCLMALGLYVAIYFPAQVTLQNSSNTYASVLQIKKQKEDAQDTQKTLANIWKELPAQKDFTRLSVSIASLAKTHHVHIPGMGYDLETPRHKLATKGILSFEASGQYKAIRTFIYELESQWPNVFIEKLSVERSKKSNDVGFKIKISTFLRRSPENSTLSSQPL